MKKKACERKGVEKKSGCVVEEGWGVEKKGWCGEWVVW